MAAATAFIARLSAAVEFIRPRWVAAVEADMLAAAVAVAAMPGVEAVVVVVVVVVDTTNLRIRFD
jgi:predicted RNA methylase